MFRKYEKTYRIRVHQIVEYNGNEYIVARVVHDEVLLVRNTELAGLNKETKWLSRRIAKQILIIKKERS